MIVAGKRMRALWEDSDVLALNAQRLPAEGSHGFRHGQAAGARLKVPLTAGRKGFGLAPISAVEEVAILLPKRTCRDPSQIMPGRSGRALPLGVGKSVHATSL